LIGFIGWLNLLDWLNRESERIPRGLPRGGFNWLVKHIGDDVAVKENRHRNGWFFFQLERREKRVLFVAGCE
jgi:hypothetical protein